MIEGLSCPSSVRKYDLDGQGAHLTINRKMYREPAGSFLFGLCALVQDALDRRADRLVGTMDAANPAAGAAHAFDEFYVRSLNAAIAGVDKFGVFYPTNPLVAREWRDVIPEN